MATAYQQRVDEAMRKAGNAVAAGATIKGATPAMPNVKQPQNMIGGVAGGIAAAVTPKVTGVVPPTPQAQPVNTPKMSVGGAAAGIPAQSSIPGVAGGVVSGAANTPQRTPVAAQVKGVAAPPTPNYFTPDTSNAQTIPNMQSNIPAMDWAAIQKYADDQMAAEMLRQKSAADQAIAAGKLTADQQTAALRQSAERLRGDITEQRTLENVSNDRNLNPFSGRTSFQKGMIERERGKTDRQLAENQQMQEANILSNLAQLQNEIQAKLTAIQQTSGAEREKLVQSLRDSERQYSLQEAQLEINRGLANSQIKNTDFNQDLSSWQANRGAYEFDKTFGYQQQQDKIQNDAQYGGTYGGNKTVQQQQQEWNNRFDYGNAIGQFGNGQKTQQAKQFEFQKAQQEWENNFRQGQFDWEKAQTTWENTFKSKSFEQDMKDAAASRGLQWASLSQRDKEFIADQEWREKQFTFDQSQNATGNFNDIISQMEKLYVTQDPDTGTPLVSNPTALRSAIIARNLPDDQTDQLLLHFGLQTN